MLQAGVAALPFAAEQFVQQLAELRTQKGFSARDMSLFIGKSPNYINRIENGKAFPTMANFFYSFDYDPLPSSGSTVQISWAILNTAQPLGQSA